VNVLGRLAEMQCQPGGSPSPRAACYSVVKDRFEETRANCPEELGGGTPPQFPSRLGPVLEIDGSSSEYLGDGFFRGKVGLLRFRRRERVDEERPEVLNCRDQGVEFK
jgi:hypothetical protein